MARTSVDRWLPDLDRKLPDTGNPVFERIGFPVVDHVRDMRVKCAEQLPVALDVGASELRDAVRVRVAIVCDENTAVAKHPYAFSEDLADIVRLVEGISLVH